VLGKECSTFLRLSAWWSSSHFKFRCVGRYLYCHGTQKCSPFSM